jgi:hypothetical protein
MEMANQMLSEIKAANKRKTLDGTSSTASKQSHRTSKTEPRPPPGESVDTSMSKLSLTPQSQHTQIPSGDIQSQTGVSSQTTASPKQGSSASSIHSNRPPPVLPAHGQVYQQNKPSPSAEPSQGQHSSTTTDVKKVRQETEGTIIRIMMT